MDALYPLFFENLQDNIPSVREGAAIALANVVKAYGGFNLTYPFLHSCQVPVLYYVWKHYLSVRLNVTTTEYC